MRRLVLFLSLMIFAMTAAAMDHSNCPHHAEHQKQVAEKGDQVMGFEHTKTTHHFQLKPDGGMILADAIDPNDQHSIEQIRKHFVGISAMFSKGDFSTPREIHGKVPPGVSKMIELKDSISYVFQKTDTGGEIRILTQDQKAIEAIHEFLRFQIEEHQTGD